MDRDPPYAARRSESSSGRVLATVTTLGLGALAGLAAYAVLAPAGAPLRDPLRRPFLPAPEPRGNADDAPGHAARRARWGDKAVVGRSVTIGKPREEIWAFLREPANLARFMENIEAVTDQGDGSHAWTIRGPLERPLRIVTRPVNVREGEEVGWRSTDDSEVATEGKVRLKDAGDRGTIVEAIIAWTPPGGEVGRLAAKLLQAEPGIQARRDLKRLRMLLETGEIATSHFNKSQEQDQ